MGGDNAPRMVLRGANIARKRYPDAEFMLFGDEAKLRPPMRRLPFLRKACSIYHTDEVIADDTKPSQALRSGRHSSMRKAIDAVRKGEAQGLVSAGNTGALMAMSKVVLKALPGIDRPAMASFFPTLKGESVMLDLGANIECSAKNLVQFAVMGELFARTVLGRLQPTVGLLNVGSEEIKGIDSVKEAASLLRSGHGMNFQGFIEGDDIAAGTVDVVVTDGFSGNIALKAAEGTARLYSEFLRQAFKTSVVAGIGYLLSRRALNKLRKRVDPRRYNGAVFLGVNGVSVKSHGGSDAFGFATAIGVAVDMARNGFVDNMKREFETPAAAEPPKARAAAG